VLASCIVDEKSNMGSSAWIVLDALNSMRTFHLTLEVDHAQTTSVTTASCSSCYTASVVPSSILPHSYSELSERFALVQVWVHDVLDMAQGRR
jgi:hypothetical protein